MTSSIAPLPDGPHDIEFFFDPVCPFAWQTSVWVRKLIELKGITVGWRFISLLAINEDKDSTEPMRQGHLVGRRFHRICATARAEGGNEAVAKIYQAFGERLWYQDGEGDFETRYGATQSVDAVELLESIGLPIEWAASAEDESLDALIVSESNEAFERAGADVGTPVITFNPPNGNSLFGPVISSVPDDETSVAFYDALRVMVDFEGFSELKRTKRPPLELPLLQ